MIKYGDKVRILYGFYEGYKGIVLKENVLGMYGDERITYTVEFDTGIENIKHDFTEDSLTKE